MKEKKKKERIHLKGNTRFFIYIKKEMKTNITAPFKKRAAKCIKRIVFTWKGILIWVKSPLYAPFKKYFVEMLSGFIHIKTVSTLCGTTYHLKKGGLEVYQWACVMLAPPVFIHHEVAFICRIWAVFSSGLSPPAQSRMDAALGREHLLSPLTVCSTADPFLIFCYLCLSRNFLHLKWWRGANHNRISIKAF